MAAEADYKSQVNHGAGGGGVSRTKGWDHLSHLISSTHGAQTGADRTQRLGCRSDQIRGSDTDQVLLHRSPEDGCPRSDVGGMTRVLSGGAAEVDGWMGE